MLEGVRQPDVFHTVHLRPVRGDAFEFQQEHGLQQGGLVSLSLAAFYPLYQVVPATVGVGQNVGTTDVSPYFIVCSTMPCAL